MICADRTRCRLFATVRYRGRVRYVASEDWAEIRIGGGTVGQPWHVRHLGVADTKRTGGEPGECARHLPPQLISPAPRPSGGPPRPRGRPRGVRGVPAVGCVLSAPMVF